MDPWATSRMKRATSRPVGQRPVRLESHPARFFLLPLCPSFAKNKHYEPWNCYDAPSDRLSAKQCRDFRQSGFLWRLSEQVHLSVGINCLHPISYSWSSMSASASTPCLNSCREVRILSSPRQTTQASAIQLFLSGLHATWSSRSRQLLSPRSKQK